MTALAESDLFMQASSVYPFSLTLPHERVGKDKNSLGLFQQRLQWWFEKETDTVEERIRTLMDPVRSARLFYNALLRIPQWQTLEPWVVAQRVQGSAFDGVTINPATGKIYGPYGQNYRDRMLTARAAIAGAPTYFTSQKGTS